MNPSRTPSVSRPINTRHIGIHEGVVLVKGEVFCPCRRRVNTARLAPVENCAVLRVWCCCRPVSGLLSDSGGKGVSGAGLG